jgi:hypothetical protein
MYEFFCSNCHSYGIYSPKNDMEVHKNLPNKVFSLAMIQSELARNLSTIQHISMGFTPQTWEVVRKNGWTAGQNLEFLILTLQPLSSILRFPKLLFRIFSRAEKPSVSFEEIRNIYLGKVNESLDLPVSLQPEDAPKDRLLMLAEFEYYNSRYALVVFSCKRAS